MAWDEAESGLEQARHWPRGGSTTAAVGSGSSSGCVAATETQFKSGRVG